MFTTINFKTKRELWTAVMLWATGRGEPVTYFNQWPRPGKKINLNGTIPIEGPHRRSIMSPQPIRWRAHATVEDGVIIKVATVNHQVGNLDNPLSEYENTTE